jgi:uncharacterized protein involved in exopolysaccharide biosynthesis
MTVTERRTRDLPPDLDAEQEIDLRRYWSTVAARWWLPLAGLLVGAAAGYLISLGGTQTYKAQSVVNLGTPLAVGGGILPSVQTNAAAVRQVVQAEATLRRVASQVGLRPGQLRGKVSATAVGGGSTRATGPVTLFAITVKGPAPHKIARAANALATIVLDEVSAPYVDVKIATLESQVKADEEQLDLINERIAQITGSLSKLSGAEQIAATQLLSINEQRRFTIQQDLLQARPLLAQAQTVERGRVLTRAVASRTTAQSRRNSVVVGALIGLIVGVAAALLWERVVRRPSL